MKKYFILSLICLFATQYMWAQPTTNRIPKEKMMQIGDERFDAKDTYTALEWYQKAHDADPNDVFAIYKVANTHDKLRDYAQASEWYGKLVEADTKNEYPLARYRYANALKMNGEYDKAITEFQKFSAAYTGDDADYHKTRAGIEIEGAQLAKEWGEEPSEELVIENLGANVNSSSSEGGAYPMGRETIIYSSLRSDTLIFVEEGTEDDSKFAKIYTTKKSDEDGAEWEEAQAFNPEAILKKGFHVVQPAFSTDLSKFYFVRAQLSGNMLENSRIYYAPYNDGEIGEPAQLDFNSNKYACKNPSVAKWGDKEYLLFSSNMPGGEGGFDIWYAEINEDGSTKQPLNMGSTINTIADDMTPFFDERDNNLYFASQGHPGMGGFDIFRIQRNPNTEEWTQVENMKSGFNSRVDDFGFIINKEGKDDCYAYVISNRPGTMSLAHKSETCCDDIFSVLMPERCDIICNVDVYDQDSNAPLDGATVQVIDKATGEVVDEQTNTEGNNYTFLLEMGKDYEIVAKKEGREAGKTETTTQKEELIAKGFDITRPVEFGEQVALKELGLMVETYNKKTGQPLSGVTVVVYDAASGDVVKELSEAGGNRFTFVIPRTKNYKIAARATGFVGDNKDVAKADMGTLQKLYLTPPPLFVNIYFNFDKHNIRQGAADTLDQVLATLNEYPELIVEVRGHTDAKGSNTYNNKLSQQRSDAAIKYLIEKGVDKSRLVPKGFGEDQPAAPNATPEGVDDPNGRQLNRRVEFKILEGTVGATESSEPTNVATTDTKKKQ